MIIKLTVVLVAKWTRTAGQKHVPMALRHGHPSACQDSCAILTSIIFQGSYLVCAENSVKDRVRSSRLSIVLVEERTVINSPPPLFQTSGWNGGHHCMNEVAKTLVFGWLSTAWELTRSQRSQRSRSHCALPQVFAIGFNAFQAIGR